MRAPSLSIVIPAFNEQGNLAPLHTEIAAMLDRGHLDAEIIFVDDGSNDGSAEKLRALRRADSRVRVLTFARNAGQTAALAAGFAAARGHLVVTLDADRQNDPDDIPLLLDQIHGHDAAVGWRAARHDTWLRRLSSRIANSVRNSLSQDDIIDTGCSLKAYRREAVAGLKLYNGMHRFLPTLLRMEGFRVCQVPVSHRPRVAGVSKYNVRNRVFRSFADLLAVRWMKLRRIEYRLVEESESPEE